MRVPANHVFSKRYSPYGICGALGLSDHGCSWESDMVQCVRGGGISAGTGSEVGRRGPEVKQKPLGYKSSGKGRPNGDVAGDEWETSGRIGKSQGHFGPSSFIVTKPCLDPGPNVPEWERSPACPVTMTQGADPYSRGGKWIPSRDASGGPSSSSIARYTTERADHLCGIHHHFPTFLQ